MKYIRVLLEDGTKVRFSEDLKKGDIWGIILKEGKIISLNISEPIQLYKSNFSSSDIIKKSNQEEAEKDMDGIGNTKKLLPYLKIKLGENEYIPSLAELKLAISQLNNINWVRERLGLESVPLNYFWSSTVDDKEIWVVYSGNGNVDLRYWGWSRYQVLFFLGE